MIFDKKFISLYLLALSFLCFAIVTNAQQSINEITITVVFDGQPESYTVNKAPLKYNKAFALSFQIDNGRVDLANKVYPTFNNLKYTDGCGNDKVFTAASPIFCFFEENENGPDMHNPSSPAYDDYYLSWENIRDLYEINYGIFNQGVNENDAVVDDFMDYSIKRNRSFVRRRMYNATSGSVISSLFSNPSQVEEWTQPAFDNGYGIAFNDQDDGPLGDNGGNVNNAEFNWTENQYVKRRKAHSEVNVLDYVNTLNDQSIDGENYWGSLYAESINGNGYPQSVFESDFANIASIYGKSGLDNILLASDEEIYDYLNIRDAVTVNENLNGEVLEITFSNSVPDDLRYYAMSLVVDADVDIKSIYIEGNNGFSTNKSIGLINFYWNDQIVPDNEEIAEEHTAIAEISETQYDAWIAMDYVYTLPLDSLKVALADRLCALEGLTFDEGFCDITIDTIVKIYGDTVYCLGDTVILTATAGMDYYEWSDGQSTQTLKVIGQTEDKAYWVKGTLNGNSTTDNVMVVINPVPEIILHSNPYITHQLGINDTLWVSTEDVSLTYLWNTTETDSTLVVSPLYSTNYYVDVSNESGCSTRQDFVVKVEETFQFTYDSICFGDTTTLINISSYPDSVIAVLWDLNSDGVFDDAEGDTIKHQFAEYGNLLVGMRLLLAVGGIEVVFNVVPVGDSPQVEFEVKNNCIPGTTTFDDKSTLIVGDIIYWEWDFGDGDTLVGKYVSHTYFTADAYDVKLIVTSSIGCRDSLTKVVEMFESPVFNILNSDGAIINEWDTTKVDKYDSLYVTISNASSFDSISWNNTVMGPEYYVTTAGDYSVDVFDGLCSSTKISRMEFNSGGNTPTTNEIMNLFTPNGDGYNDSWIVNDPNISRPFKVSVYNRYGNLVYSSENYVNDWKGTYNDVDLPQATYYYVIVDYMGVIFKGPISILR